MGAPSGQDGCAHWTGWVRPMEKMGASSEWYECLYWKQWVLLLDNMGAFSGFLWVAPVEETLLFLLQTG